MDGRGSKELAYLEAVEEVVKLSRWALPNQSVASWSAAHLEAYSEVGPAAAE